MRKFRDLEPGEAVIPPGPALLFRQITAHQWDDVNLRPSSASFGPSTVDVFRPSFALEGPAVDAQSARDWHQDNAKSPSLGVWAVSALEVSGTGLRSVDDTAVPAAPGEHRAPGHAYVDYRDLAKKEERDVRKELLLRAIDRGELPTIDKLAPSSATGQQVAS